MELAKVRKQLNEYLSRGLIRPSTSLSGATILFARKKDATPRICIDYRVLHQQTRPDKYPLPSTDDLLDWLVNANYLSSIDFYTGYHQVAICPGDEYKTALLSRYSLFKFFVLPSSLINSSSIF